MNTQPNTAQALWDARDELQEFEQQTQEDGFTIVLAGGFIEVFDFGVDSITITAWQAGRKPPLNKTVVEVWGTVTACALRHRRCCPLRRSSHPPRPHDQGGDLMNHSPEAGLQSRTR